MKNLKLIGIGILSAGIFYSTPTLAQEREMVCQRIPILNIIVPGGCKYVDKQPIQPQPQVKKNQPAIDRSRRIAAKPSDCRELYEGTVLKGNWCALKD